MKLRDTEIKGYMALNEINTTAGGVVILGGTQDRQLPTAELKEAFHLEMNVYNRSLTELTVADAIEVFDRSAAALEPDYVLLHLGRADLARFSVDAAGFERDYRALIAHIRAVCGKGTAIAVVSLDNPNHSAMVAEMDRRLKLIAESERVEFCDVRSMSWKPAATREVMDFVSEVGFMMPLRIKRPVYDVARVFFAYSRAFAPAAELTEASEQTVA